MRAIDRKLLRDCTHMAGQLAAIALIVAAAIATYVTMRGSYEALRRAGDGYYSANRFASVFAQCKRAPLRVAADIESVDGVSAVDPRIVVSVPLDVPQLDEPATARIVSISGRLNLLYLRSGRLPDEGSTDEVVASPQFTAANHLQPGDSLAAVLNGKWQRLRIVGIGSSPEYLVEVFRAALVPDRRRFAVLWMRREALEGSFSMRGAFNDVTLALAPHADEQHVIDRLDALLGRYGSAGAYGRNDHHPHQVLTSELAQLRVTSVVIPLIFLFVSAFLINMVLSRLVAGQRDQIAILKAFGYSNRAIAAHYAGFAILVVVAGAVIGVPAGVWLGRGTAALYLDFFDFPALRFAIAPASVAISVAVSAAAAISAALRSAFAAARVPPAEGMRGEQPPAFHPTALESFNRAISPAARMILRSIERRPMRAALSTLGIALAIMILVVGRFTFDGLEGLLTVALRTAERHDIALTFTEVRPATIAYDLARLPGVRRVEPFRAVAVRISSGHRWRRVALIGLNPRSELHRLVGSDRRAVPLPDHGVVLTKALADALGVKAGDRVRFDVLEQKRNSFESDVAATVDELMGIAAYARGSEVARLLGEDDIASGAYLSVDRKARTEVGRRLKQMPVIAGVMYREQMIASFLETVAKSLSASTQAIVIFACVLAFGVVYNSARIALAERGRDLATLRVLGFTRGEAGALLLGEQAILTVAGIPIGFALGRLLAMWLVRLFSTEEYRLLDAVSGKTYAFAFAVVILASAVSALAVWRRISNLDLVEVLKTRE